MALMFVQILDPQPPEETHDVSSGGDGWIYAMPAPGVEDPGALAWWKTTLIPYLDGSGVWCLGDYTA